MKNIYSMLAILFMSIAYGQNFLLDASYGINGVVAPTHFKPNNINIGIGYNFNDTYGLRFDIASDKFIYNENLLNGSKNIRYSLNGVINILSFLNLKNGRENFDIDTHLGMGYSYFKSNNPQYTKADNIMNVIVGITPKYWLSESLAIKTDFSTVLNLSQHYLFNGEITYTNTPNGITGIYYTINAGLLYKF